MRRSAAPAPRARSLPSMVDALFIARGQAGATTGMMASSSGGSKRGREDAVDITECTDTEFDAWLEMQKPNLHAQNAAFEHKMMQEWMTLTTAATEALMALVSATVSDIASSKGPQLGLGEFREDYPTAQDLANQSKAMRLLARAQKVQARMSAVA